MKSLLLLTVAGAAFYQLIWAPKTCLYVPQRNEALVSALHPYLPDYAAARQALAKSTMDSCNKLWANNILTYWEKNHPQTYHFSLTPHTTSTDL